MFAYLVRRGLVRKVPLAAVGAAAVALLLDACGSSTTTATNTGKSTATSSAPGATFATANVSGLGAVVVDGKGKTVYILTSGGHTNVPCTEDSGCTKVWPDLPLPDGASTAKAGSGIQASLLSTKKVSDGETYSTYNGWLMYEYAADSGGGQASGQGIKSFGGTWYVLNPSGNPITSASRSGGSGY